MLRQIFTTDPTTINAAIAAYRMQAGPKLSHASLPVLIPLRSALRADTTGAWREPFACYKEQP